MLEHRVVAEGLAQAAYLDGWIHHSSSVDARILFMSYTLLFK